MEIRPTEAGDFDAIAALTNHFIRETAVHFGDREVGAAELCAGWEAGREVYPWLTAVADGAFAGFAKSGVWRDRAAYRPTCETAIYLVEGARGQGIGRALYGALMDELRARGFHTVVAGLTVPNEASARVHEAVGFSYVATFREVGRKFDAWHDVAFYQLML